VLYELSAGLFLFAMLVSFPYTYLPDFCLTRLRLAKQTDVAPMMVAFKGSMDDLDRKLMEHFARVTPIVEVRPYPREPVLPPQTPACDGEAKESVLQLLSSQPGVSPTTVPCPCTPRTTEELKPLPLSPTVITASISPPVVPSYASAVCAEILLKPLPGVWFRNLYLFLFYFAFHTLR